MELLWPTHQPQSQNGAVLHRRKTESLVGPGQSGTIHDNSVSIMRDGITPVPYFSSGPVRRSALIIQFVDVKPTHGRIDLAGGYVGGRTRHCIAAPHQLAHIKNRASVNPDAYGLWSSNWERSGSGDLLLF